jgi:hypothetical protein
MTSPSPSPTGCVPHQPRPVAAPRSPVRTRLTRASSHLTLNGSVSLQGQSMGSKLRTRRGTSSVLGMPPALQRRRYWGPGPLSGRRGGGSDSRASRSPSFHRPLCPPDEAEGRPDSLQTSNRCSRPGPAGPATDAEAGMPLRGVLAGLGTSQPRSLPMRWASRVAVPSSQLPSRWGCWSASRCWVSSSQVTWLTWLASAWPRPCARATAHTSPP